MSKGDTFKQTDGSTLPVALLAPVPLSLLEDGVAVVQQQGKVAFGSRAWEVLGRLDDLRGDQPVDVWIYASHANAGGPPKATWHARCVNIVKARSGTGAHPDGAKFRPSTATNGGEDNAHHWTHFWEVDQLRRLASDEAVLITTFRGLGRTSRYQNLFVPEGPLVVHAL